MCATKCSIKIELYYYYRSNNGKLKAQDPGCILPSNIYVKESQPSGKGKSDHEKEREKHGSMFCTL